MMNFDNFVNAKDINHDNVIVETLPDYLWSKRYADVVFVCRGSKMVQAHRLLLGAISPFLRELFMEQAGRDIIEISLPDVTVTDLTNVLRFAYEGVVRLDDNELEAFKSVNLMLGMKISTEVLNSNSGEVIETSNEHIELNNNSSRDVIDKEEIITSIQHNEHPGLKRKCEEDPKVMKTSIQHNEHPGLKRKCDEDPKDIPSKKPNRVIQNINNIVSNLSKAPPVENNQPKPINSKPFLVPMKYLPTVLAVIERRKAEKRLEELIETYVKNYLSRVRSQKRPTKSHN